MSATIIYKLHPTKNNGLKTVDIFREFLEPVDSLAMNDGHLLNIADINIHLNQPISGSM